MATSISLTNDEIQSIYNAMEFIETNSDGSEKDLEESLNIDLKRLGNIVKKFKESNLRKVCRSELKKYGANTKENVDKMIEDLKKNQ